MSPKNPLIIVAPSPTPFKQDQVDFSAIEHNVERWMTTDLDGFVLGTENGEETYLSEKERLDIVRHVSEMTDRRKWVIAGIDSPSVTDTLRQSEQLAESGADMIRLRIPRRKEEIFRYFEQVVPRISIPVIVIHQPKPGFFDTGLGSTGAEPEAIIEAVSRENVYGYICSGNVRVEARVRLHFPENKSFWASNGSLLLSTSTLAVNGACLMLGNILPETCKRLLQAMRQDDLRQAREIHQRIIEADWEVLKHGAAGIKAALTILGFQMGPPRDPSLPITKEQIDVLERVLKQADAFSEFKNSHST